MTKLLNSFNNFAQRIVHNLIPSFSGMLRVKAGRPLVNWILRSVLLVKGSITNSLVKVSVSYVRTLYVLSRKSGLAYTVKYLKASTSLLMQAISGVPHKDTRELGCAISRTNKGLPRIIPRLHRDHIRKGNVFYIRLWLTFFSIYRVLDYTGKLKIGTIIKPSTATSINLEEVASVTVDFIKGFKLPIIETMAIERPFPLFNISTTSPNSALFMLANSKTCSTSVYSLIGSLIAWGDNESLRLKLNALGIIFKIDKSVRRLFSFAIYARNYTSFIMTSQDDKDTCDIRCTSLGKLAYKVEPAGKIRVFAMVDAFTQWFMKPLHNELFYRLSLLAQDATHNQNKTLSDFVKRLEQKAITKVYSFDLTAATDRMPLSVQKVILDQLVDRPIGDIWGSVLVDRWYDLPLNSWGNTDEREISCQGMTLEEAKGNPFIQLSVNPKTGKHFISSVKYAVGQPMGALSSWAMLAMTHHIMVSVSASRVGKFPFKDYLVLGDDLVIADKAVADSYLRLADEWGVGINLSKSVLSNNGSLEFAKRFIYRYQDVSGLSFKEMAVAKYDLRGLLQLFTRISLFREIKVSQLLSFLGHGYKALSRITTKYRKMSKGMSKALLLLSYPNSLFSTMSTVSSWLLSPSFNKPGIVSMPDEGVEFIKSLCLGVADKVTLPEIPQTDEDFDRFWSQINGREGVVTNDVNIDKGIVLRDQFRPMLLHWYRQQVENAEIALIEVKDTFEYEEDLDADTLWSYLETLEDISNNVADNPHLVSKDTIQTLNRSVLLKRAYTVRSYIRSLSEKILT